MPLVVLNGPTIAAGQSLSEGLDCSAGVLVRLTMPPEWSPAPLTFQISSDNVFYNDVFGADGYEVTVPHVIPGAAIILESEIGRAVAWVKFRSGTRSQPVPQEAQRNFAVAIRSEEPAAPPAADAMRAGRDPRIDQAARDDGIGVVDPDALAKFKAEAQAKHEALQAKHEALMRATDAEQEPRPELRGTPLP
jgi:hypothetical protein